MQLVKGGPNIPYEVLTAQEEGRLIFFCGAGVSMKAGLPDFKGLIMSIYSELRAEPDPKEKKAIEEKAFERVIELLDERFGYRKIRELVSELLQVPPNPDLSVHSAILKLSENRENQYKEFATRLVTTNFDLLFEEASSSLESLYAPPSRDNWSGIVHLHGIVGASSTHVLNSAEFGDAYVLNGVTSRFIYDLIQKYTILFVGYGIGDTVVQYLLKALSAGRRRGEEIQKAYALLSCEPYNNEDGELSGVTPIYYDSSGNHELLHKSLDWWAKSYSGGLRFKIDTMRQVATRKPSELGYEKEHLLWAIQDSKVANEFSKLGNQVDFAWCEEFDKAGFLNTPGKSENALIRGYCSPDMFQRLDQRQLALAYWILNHMGNPDTVRWMVSKGHILHEEVKWLLRPRLNDPTMPEPLQVAWSVLLGIVPLDKDENRETHYLHLWDRVGSESWSPKLRTQILMAFSPCLKIEPLGRLDFVKKLFPEFSKAQEELTINSLFHSRCVLRSGKHTDGIYEKFVNREDWPVIALDCAFSFTELLRRAMDMQAVVGIASETHDSSYMDIEHIAEPLRDIEFSPDKWIILATLLWRAYDCVRKESLETASALVDTWKTHRYPVFRRLILAAVSQGIEEEANR